MGLIDGLISPISTNANVGGASGSTDWADIISTPTTLVGYGITDSVALTTNPLGQFAATTSTQLAGVISDETGTGSLVFNTSPTLITPALGTPQSGNLSNCSGLKTINTSSLFGTGNLVISEETESVLSRRQLLGSSLLLETYAAERIIGSIFLVDGTAYYSSIYCPSSMLITGVAYFIGLGNFVGDNENAIALYSYSSGTLTKIATTANTASIWELSNGFRKQPFLSPVVLNKGIYFIAALYNNSSQLQAPTIRVSGSFVPVCDETNSAKLFATRLSQNTLPATESMNNLTLATNLVYFALY